MGSSFNERVYKDYNDKTAKSILAKWNNAVENDLYENGHDYSGGIGMLGEGFSLLKEIFDTEDQARMWVEEYHRKWDKALGVRFKDGDKVNILIGGWCSE